MKKQWQSVKSFFSTKYLALVSFVVQTMLGWSKNLMLKHHLSSALFRQLLTMTESSMVGHETLGFESADVSWTLLEMIEKARPNTAWCEGAFVERLLALTHQSMRCLILARGLDPDYIAPPKVAEPVEKKPMKKVLQIPWDPPWIRKSFQEPGVHPIVELRKSTPIAEPSLRSKLAQGGAVDVVAEK